MTEDYRAIAMQWVTEPHRADVDAIARHLHYNESLHLHENVESKEPCWYCWLRAAKAVQAIERADRRISKSADHNELRDKRTDLLNIRGILSPQGRSLSLGPVVPMPLGDEVAPAVEWLAAEVERLRADRDRARDAAAALTQENARLQAGITDAISDVQAGSTSEAEATLAGLIGEDT
jgi:outer membrane murein-binding lipoprotein Lpp